MSCCNTVLCFVPLTQESNQRAVSELMNGGARPFSSLAVHHCCALRHLVLCDMEQLPSKPVHHEGEPSFSSPPTDQYRPTLLALEGAGK